MHKLKISRPCEELLRKTNSEGIHYCPSCQKHIIDLSNYSEHEAKTFLFLFGRKPPCIQYQFNSDDDIVFRTFEQNDSPNHQVAPAGKIPLVLALLLSSCTSTTLPQNTRSTDQRTLPRTNHPLPASSNEAEKTRVQNETHPRKICYSTMAEYAEQSLCTVKGTPAEDCVFPLTALGFFSGRAEITPLAANQLLSVAKFLNKYRHFKTVVIHGHAASNEHNPEELSKRRATAVYEFLIANEVQATRLQIKDWAASSPAKGATAAEVQAASPRVEFEVTEICVE